MRYNKKLLVPALATTLGLLAIPASRAMADNAASVPLGGFSQVVADPGTGDVFVNGSSGITVTDSSGTVLRTLDPGSGFAGLALNGSTLYAANTSVDEIDQFDVSAVSDGQSPVATYPLGNGDVPHGIAFQAGELWVSYTGSSGTGIGSVDLSSSSFSADASGGNWSSAPDLAADPQNGGTVVAVTGGTAATFTASGSGLTAVAAQASLASCSAETQLAVVPGGGSFFAACGSSASEYSTSGLSQQATYDGGSVAVGSDGTVAVGSSTAVDVYGSDGKEKYVFNLGADLEPGGLAWDNSTLVAVTGDGVEVFGQPSLSPTLSATATGYTGYVSFGGRLALGDGASPPSGAQVTVTRTDPDGTTTTLPATPVGPDGSFTVTDTSVTATGNYTYTVTYDGGASASTTVTVDQNAAKLTLGGPATAGVTKTVNLTGSVTLLGGTVPQGTTVAVTRQLAGATATTLPAVPVGSDGSFSLPQTIGTLGTYTYKFTYNGDTTDGVAAVTATEKLTVTKNTPTLAMSGPTEYIYEPKIWVTAHLGSTYTNRTVAIYAQTAGSGTKRLLMKGTVNSNGNLIIALTTPSTTTFTAVFTGDARYAARTVTHTVTVQGSVALSINGYYSSKAISGTTYRLYHHTGQLDVDATVGPNKYGECVWLEVQEYYNGAWHGNKNTSCASLSPASKLSGYLSFTNADLGPYYRIRAHYLPSSSDVLNAGAITGWQYLIVNS
ncbi:MAG TPA: hypothetical protein VF060_08130 [Trebonia sp.]